MSKLSLYSLYGVGRTFRQCGSEFCGEPTPDVYAFERQGRRWITNRYWMFDEKIVDNDWLADSHDDTDSRFSYPDLPVGYGPALKLVDRILTEELTTQPAELQPLWAALLTEAGFSVPGRTVDENPKTFIVVDRDGLRVGCIAGYTNPAMALPVPVSDKILALRERIGTGTGTVASLSSWQAWMVAAHLGRDS